MPKKLMFLFITFHAFRLFTFPSNYVVVVGDQNINKMDSTEDAIALESVRTLFFSSTHEAFSRGKIVTLSLLAANERGVKFFFLFCNTRNV